MYRELRIVFMGTPQFAAASLEAIVSAGYDVVAVITAPDKPSGRGKKLTQSAVKQSALELGLKILQPQNLKATEFIAQFKALRANLGVVVAFRMLPEIIWSMPELGTINLHASLLPQYRGAAPINHAIINGEPETGVTTFFLRHEIDTGDVLLTEKVSIGYDETAGELHDKLMIKGADLVLKSLKIIESGDYKLRNQDGLMDGVRILKTAPRIFKDDCLIHWNRSCEDIYNLIRGLSPVPGAFSYLSNQKDDVFAIKIFQSKIRLLQHNSKPGEIESNDKDFFGIYCLDGIIQIDELQLQGKKRMKVQDFLNGFKISEGWRMVEDLT
jgi:methionyl-tRNA formyltransferase